MPKSLLLADDSITIQRVVGITFANEDYEITTVDNGDDAILKAKEQKPDIVLADVIMPKKNGYEVCEAIKKDPELASIPVLLLAGTFEAFDENRAREVGANGHITKPFESQALIDKVKALVGGAVSKASPAVLKPVSMPATPQAAQPRQAPPQPHPPVAAPLPYQAPASVSTQPAFKKPAPMSPFGEQDDFSGSEGFEEPSVARPPVAPQPMAPRPIAPQPIEPKPMAPRPIAHQPIEPKPMAPRPIAPQPIEPKPMAPRPIAPQPIEPKPFPSMPIEPEPQTPSLLDPEPVEPISLETEILEPLEPEAGSMPEETPPMESVPLEWGESTDLEPLEQSPSSSLESDLDLSSGFDQVEEATAPDQEALDLPSVDIDDSDLSEESPPLAPTHEFVPPPESMGEQPQKAAERSTGISGPELQGLSREELLLLAREEIQKIAWEIVPQLAETILREEIDRLVKEKLSS